MPPLHVRVQVLRRMLDEARAGPVAMLMDWASKSSQRRIELGLKWLGIERACLDHDPALILRDYDPTVSDVAARYTPHAHDPNHLIYREKADHDRKTFGRTPGAERTVTTKGSDVWLKSKFNRLEGRTKQRPKQKIQSRGFQKRAKP
jgi:hypothetical protein